MKQIVIFFILILPMYMFSQEWILEENPDKKIKKDGRTYKIYSIEDEDHSLTFEADSIYIDINYNFMIVRDLIKKRIGLIDIWNLEWSFKPKFSYFEKINENYDWLYLGKEKGKYNIYEIEEFNKVFKKGFDTIYSFNINYSEWQAFYKIKNKGKYGIINLDDFEYYTEADYTEIQPVNELQYELLLYITLKKKKGIYSLYDNYEIIYPEYDDISLLVLDGNNSYFKVMRNDKCGLVRNNDDQIIEVEFDNIEVIEAKNTPSANLTVTEKNGKHGFYYNNEQFIPCIIDEYKCIGRQWPFGYIILKSEGKYDLLDDSLNPFEPRYDEIKIEEKEEVIILKLIKGDKFEEMEIQK